MAVHEYIICPVVRLHTAAARRFRVGRPWHQHTTRDDDGCRCGLVSWWHHYFRIPVYLACRRANQDRMHSACSCHACPPPWRSKQQQTATLPAAPRQWFAPRNKGMVPGSTSTRWGPDAMSAVCFCIAAETREELTWQYSWMSCSSISRSTSRSSFSSRVLRLHNSVSLSVWDSDAAHPQHCQHSHQQQQHEMAAPASNQAILLALANTVRSTSRSSFSSRVLRLQVTMSVNA